jgi:hypothetical protein
MAAVPAMHPHQTAAGPVSIYDQKDHRCPSINTDCTANSAIRNCERPLQHCVTLLNWCCSSAASNSIVNGTNHRKHRKHVCFVERSAFERKNVTDSLILNASNFAGIVWKMFSLLLTSTTNCHPHHDARCANYGLQRSSN